MGLYDVEYLDSKERTRRTRVFALDEHAAIGIVRNQKGNATGLKSANGFLWGCLAIGALVVILGVGFVIAGGLWGLNF